MVLLCLDGRCQGSRPGSPPRASEMVHGISDPSANPEHATLTAKGVIRLYKAGHNIDASVEMMVKNRSKLNTIEKCLIVGQVGWMALQCVVRRRYGLPLILLEVHTMVDVICTMSKYVCLLVEGK